MHPDPDPDPGPAAPDDHPSTLGPLIVVEPASSPQEVLWIRELFVEYQADIGVDLCFQGFDAELAGLPGDYAPPYGCLLLATVDGVPAGCCALRPMLEADYTNASEMKRLFVRRAYRGFGLGRQLVEQTLTLARQAGYDHVLLDTLSDMEAARILYQELGFVEIPPYYHNPLLGTHYLKASLR